MPGPELQLASWTFDQIEVGQRAEFEWHLDDADVDTFARLSGDFSPLHVDEQFSRRTRFRRRVPHGMLVAAPISALVGMCLPGRNATLLGYNVRLAAPAYIGDRLVARGTVTAVSPATRAIVLQFTIARTTNDQTVATGEAQVLVNNPPKEGLSMSEIASLGLGMDFTGHVALVTGASRGIGEMTAKLFAHHGAKVVVNYYKGRDDAERIVADIAAAGHEAVALEADVRVADEVQRIVEEAGERLGSVDILVNNAVGDYFPNSIDETTWDDMALDLDVVVHGAFNCIQAVLPGMRARGFGRIVNVSTIYTSTPPARSARYVTAKSALVGLTRALSVELAGENVLVNAVAPGMAETDLTAHLPAPTKAGIGAGVPVGRLAEPLDVAKAIVFLASPYADYVSGHQLVVSGGG